MLVDLTLINSHHKPYADSTLNNMKKSKLIEYVRMLEHNYNVAVSFNHQQAKNIEKMLEQKWIPVSEPPKVKKIEKSYGVVYRKSENVLCSCIVMGGKRMTKPGYLVYINDNPQPQWRIRGDWYSVTHWMPLPEPPKECE